MMPPEVNVEDSELAPPADLGTGEMARLVYQIQDRARVDLERYLDNKLGGLPWRSDFSSDGVDLQAVLGIFTSGPESYRTRALPDRRARKAQHEAARSFANVCRNHRNTLAHLSSGKTIDPEYVADMANDFARLFEALAWVPTAALYAHIAREIHRLIHQQPVAEAHAAANEALARAEAEKRAAEEAQRLLSEESSRAAENLAAVTKELEALKNERGGQLEQAAQDFAAAEQRARDAATSAAQEAAEAELTRVDDALRAFESKFAERAEAILGLLEQVHAERVPAETPTNAEPSADGIESSGFDESTADEAPLGANEAPSPDLQELLARLSGGLRSAELTPRVHGTPGQRWTHVGEYLYLLNARLVDVRDYKEPSRLLSEVIGPVRARRVAESLLAHRPEGGAIRVDRFGNVSTQRKSGGGRFFLGTVSADEWFPGVLEGDGREGSDDQDDDSGTLPSPGEPWPYRAGAHWYSIRPSIQDIEEHRTGKLLSEVIGRKRASAVVTALLEHRPEGGIIAVDSDGDVSTQRRSHEARFYLGRVSTRDWFDGVMPPVHVDKGPI
jgi:hypothetical protein